MRVILLGAPGAGKGTQGKKIQEKTGIAVLVMGNILREAVRSNDKIGVEVSQYITKGELVPDQLVTSLIVTRLQQKDCQDKGFLLDGFPRTSEQAKSLDKEMAARKIKLDHVLYYVIPDEIAISRIIGRRICSNCDTVYHLQNNPPAKENICDVCGSKLSQREDDNPEVISKRLATYYAKTTPLLQYYEKQKLLRQIPANRPIDLIFQETLKVLGVR